MAPFSDICTARGSTVRNAQIRPSQRCASRSSQLIHGPGAVFASRPTTTGALGPNPAQPSTWLTEPNELPTRSGSVVRGRPWPGPGTARGADHPDRLGKVGADHLGSTQARVWEEKMYRSMCTVGSPSRPPVWRTSSATLRRSNRRKARTKTEGLCRIPKRPVPCCPGDGWPNHGSIACPGLACYMKQGSDQRALAADAVLVMGRDASSTRRGAAGRRGESGRFIAIPATRHGAPGR
jgi:hypothetical protein